MLKTRSASTFARATARSSLALQKQLTKFCKVMQGNGSAVPQRADFDFASCAIDLDANFSGTDFSGGSMPRRFIKFTVTDDQYAMLKAGADDVGVPPSVHARYLALHAGQLSFLADRVAATAADVADLRRVLATLADPTTGPMVDKASLKRGMQMLLDAIRADLKTTLTQR